jgi:dTDP-glucose pyrophosphorylase
MLGIIPAAGAARRLQPLPFSKELLPVGSRVLDGSERPRAVSELIVERLICGGATRLCFIIAPRKVDILSYYGASVSGVPVSYVVQPEPLGLCDAIFRALPFAERDEYVAIGLPDTVWFPVDALRALPEKELGMLLFPVAEPQHFDAVVTDEADAVLEVQVKRAMPSTSWIWGALGMPKPILDALHGLWQARSPRDEYIGSVINEYLRGGGRARGVRAGTSYVDVGTVSGYRVAFASLHEQGEPRP